MCGIINIEKGQKKKGEGDFDEKNF
jgi:hypothetical protein